MQIPLERLHPPHPKDSEVCAGCIQLRMLLDNLGITLLPDQIAIPSPRTATSSIPIRKPRSKALVAFQTQFKHLLG